MVIYLLTTTSNDIVVTEIDNLKPIDEVIPENLPYSKYKIMQDSVVTLRKLKNGDIFMASSNSSFGPFATYSSNYCNDCDLKYHPGATPAFYDSKLPVQYYIKLSQWKIKQTFFPDSVRFYVNNGRAYLRKILIDSTHIAKNGSIQKIACYHDIPVQFRYNHDSNCLMIPVQKSTKRICEYIFLALGLLTIAYFIFFIVGGGVKFLIDISRGQTFTLKNVRRLKLIALSLIIYPVVIFLLNLSMPLIFHRYFTADVELNNKSWLDSWETLLTGIVFLLLYKAFINGKKIKDEQDLTV